MNFDDQLKRAVDTLGDRLRDHISRELRLLTDDLTAAAKADREAAANLAAEEAAEEAEAAAQARAEQAAIEAANAVQAAVAAVRAEQAAADAERDAEQSVKAAAFNHAGTHPAAADDPEIGERLLNAIRAIDRARSLSEVLEALLASAGQEADRAGVLLVHGGRVRGWRLSGFAPSFDASAIDLELSAAGIIAIAVAQQRAASSDSDGPAPPFAELGDTADSTEAIAIPIVLAGEVVAVLYVDQPDAEPGILTLEPATLEVLVRHAARALEALTAFKAARSITHADASSAGAGASAANNGDTRGPAADEEDEAARRYARLVISEIKLYHEDAVAEGRRDRNLAARLGGEIAHARALYEQRVPAHLRGAAEHFHAELVRTLAGGDASLFEKASWS